MRLKACVGRNEPLLWGLIPVALTVVLMALVRVVEVLVQ